SPSGATSSAGRMEARTGVTTLIARMTDRHAASRRGTGGASCRGEGGTPPPTPPAGGPGPDYGSLKPDPQTGRGLPPPHAPVPRAGRAHGHRPFDRRRPLAARAAGRRVDLRRAERRALELSEHPVDHLGGGRD